MSVSLPGRRPANPFVPRPAWCRLCGHTTPVLGHCPNHNPRPADDEGGADGAS